MLCSSVQVAIIFGFAFSLDAPSFQACLFLSNLTRLSLRTTTATSRTNQPTDRPSDKLISSFFRSRSEAAAHRETDNIVFFIASNQAIAAVRQVKRRRAIAKLNFGQPASGNWLQQTALASLNSAEISLSSLA